MATTLCQLLVPVVLIAIIGLFQAIVDNQLSKIELLQPPDQFTRLQISDTAPEDLPATYIPYFRFIANSTDNNADLERMLGYLTNDAQKAGFLGNIPQIEPNYFGDEIGYFPHTIQNAGIDDLDENLVTIYKWWKEFLHDENGIGPVSSGGINLLAANQGTVGVARIPVLEAVAKMAELLENKNYTWIPPAGAFIFNKLDSVNLDVTLMPGGRYGGWTINDIKNVSKIQLLYPEADRKGSLISVMTNANMKHKFGSGAPQIFTSYQGMTQKILNAFDLAGILGVYLLGFAMSFMLPTFITNIVLDRQERVLIMMEMSGLKLPVYWLVTILYNMLVYAFVMGAMWLTGIGFGMKVFMYTDTGLLFLLFLIWGLSLNVMAFFFASFFKTPRSASISGYFIVIFSVIISNLLNGTVYLTSLPPIWYFIYPPFAFYRAIFIIEDACIRLQCLSFDKADGISYIVDQFTTVIVMLVLMTIVFGALAWLRRRSAENDLSFLKSTFLNIVWLAGLIKSLFARSQGYYSIGTSLDISDIDLEAADATDVLGSDEDVEIEKRNVLGGNISVEKTSLVIKNLAKTYSNGHQAVKGLSLALNVGESFGLLGANGAGKSTLISCLTGLQKPTSGTALFQGGELDLLERLPTIQATIGVCMQFDVFYPKLSVREHLLFYARLKGVESSELTSHVNNIIESVGLSSVKNREARFLSGGMRRRLSMGIAMIGNPALIILDEPSTGLDPLTRRQVWKVFSDMRERRKQEGNPLTVILTTHGMDEADELCDRIGIMSRGSLLCLGTAEKLKQKFSSGYTLTLQFAPKSTFTSLDVSNEQGNSVAVSINTFLYELLTSSSGGTVGTIQGIGNSFTTETGIKVNFVADQSLKYLLTYQILFPHESMSYDKFSSFLKNTFVKLLGAKLGRSMFLVEAAGTTDNLVLKEWGLNRTSLEDVFLKVVKMDKVRRK